jgi:hypothetical protein
MFGVGVESFGENVFSELSQRFSDDEKGDVPIRQIFDGIQKTVISGGRDHPSITKKRSGGQIIAGKGGIEEIIITKKGGKICQGFD